MRRPADGLSIRVPSQICGYRRSLTMHCTRLVSRTSDEIAVGPFFGRPALDSNRRQYAYYQTFKRLIEYVKFDEQTRFQRLGLRRTGPCRQGVVESETAGVAGPALPNGQDRRNSGPLNRDDRCQHLPAPSSVGGGTAGAGEKAGPVCGVFTGGRSGQRLCPGISCLGGG